MSKLVFWAIVASQFLSNSLLVLSIARPERRFWPPPEGPSWRYRVARLTGVLGPLTLIGVLVVGLLDWDHFVLHHWGRYVVGAGLLVPGGAFALWGYFGLGVRASQGRAGDLIISGAYRYSRNPQYVGAIVGVLGYVLICNSGRTLIAWVLWSVWFLLAPFAEEPWLRERLGASYEVYAAKVPRFIALRRVHGRARPSKPLRKALENER